MSSASRLLLFLLAAACLAAATATGARADGDPASDYLLSQDVFLPFNGKVPTKEAGRLDALVREASGRGYRIKVALIASRYDLGAIGALWRQPQPYARFLGQELSFVYRGRLLIVMPNGYGVSRNGKAAPAEERLLERLLPPEASPDLATAAEAAIRRLAEARGIRLGEPQASGGGRSENHDRLVLLAAVLGLAAVAAAVALVVRWLRRPAEREEGA